MTRGVMHRLAKSRPLRTLRFRKGRRRIASRWDSFAVLFVLASVVETKTILALESSPDLFEVMR